MRRREIVVGLAAAATWPLATSAQHPRTPVIGFLGLGSPATVGPALLDAFHRGLAEVGYTEGRNVAVDYVWADGLYDRLPALAAELVRRRVDVIVGAGGTTAALAAKRATTSIPIVILAGSDPVQWGLVASVNRPGGNVTGVVQLVVEVEAKRLELLRELMPGASTVALLANPKRPGSDRQQQNVEAAARALGLTLLVVEANDDGDLAPAFEAARAGARALIVSADPFFFARRDRIISLAERHSLPTMYFFREFVAAGGLVSYGSNLGNAYHHIGVYTGKILQGQNPADMPMVQQSDKLELVINLKTARVLGIQVPATLQTSADEVIE
jgi:putative tryptophan/tyrosine transport system substrate-binding protein